MHDFCGLVEVAMCPNRTEGCLFYSDTNRADVAKHMPFENLFWWLCIDIAARVVTGRLCARAAGWIFRTQSMQRTPASATPPEC